MNVTITETPIMSEIINIGAIEITSYSNSFYSSSLYEKSADKEKRVRWLEQQTVLPSSSYDSDPS